MEIPDNMLCLFTARIERRSGSHVIEIPDRELDAGAVDGDEVYRVALLPTPSDGTGGGGERRRSRTDHSGRDPPVEAGDVREVEIEGIGDQGDGIARVDRGYVVIVPDTDLGDEVAVEIEDTRANFAIGRVIEEVD